MEEELLSGLVRAMREYGMPKWVVKTFLWLIILGVSSWMLSLVVGMFGGPVQAIVEAVTGRSLIWDAIVTRATIIVAVIGTIILAIGLVFAWFVLRPIFQILNKLHRIGISTDSKEAFIQSVTAVALQPLQHILGQLLRYMDEDEDEKLRESLKELKSMADRQLIPPNTDTGHSEIE